MIPVNVRIGPLTIALRIPKAEARASIVEYIKDTVAVERGPTLVRALREAARQYRALEGKR